jgi:hypothetical protein
MQTDVGTHSDLNLVVKLVHDDDDDDDDDDNEND